MRRCGEERIAYAKAMFWKVLCAADFCDASALSVGESASLGRERDWQQYVKSCRRAMVGA